jgi:hypothetical protein
VKAPRDHNAARWLEVRHLTQPPQRQFGGLNWRGPGWYVVRTCPCHRDIAVTLPLPSEARARRARAAMLLVSGGVHADR